MPFPDMRLLAALALALAGTLVTSSPAANGSAVQVERRISLEAALVREINRVRSERRSTRPLRVAPALRTAARSHSRAMLDEGFFAHDSPDGTSFADRIRRHYSPRGWDTWSVGETILATQNTTIDARAIVASFLESPPHRRVLLARTWRDIGVGVLYTRASPKVFGGTEAVVVTADFGLREGRAGLP
jgi:uncharacterized protein YkwD